MGLESAEALDYTDKCDRVAEFNLIVCLTPDISAISP